MCREEVALLHSVCISGTEIESRLVLLCRCQGERKQWLILPGGTVSFSYVSFLNILYNVRVADQSQPLSWVLSVPVHGVVTKLLFTFQGHISSFHFEQVFSGLSDPAIHSAYGRKGVALGTRPKRVSNAAAMRERLSSGAQPLWDRNLLPEPRTHLLRGDKGPHSRSPGCP